MNFTETILNNKYQVRQIIAKGSMSDIYLANDLENNETVSVKIIKNASYSPEDIIRFRSIINTLSGLDHPNIVKIYDSGTTNGVYDPHQFIVMEYLDGKNLTEYLLNGEVLPEKEALSIISQVCKALQSVHELNIIHGDIKPGNIIITNKENGDYRIKLVDFGLSRMKSFNNLPADEKITGTFRYMAPEQSKLLHRAVDERSDLYSLGIVFYQIITGRFPFNGEKLITLLHEQIAKIPPPPSSINNQLSPKLDEIILKLLEKEPEKRYQSSIGLLNDIEKHSSGKRDFLTGEHDRSFKLNFHTRTIRRDREFNRIIKLFNKALESEGSICLISGEAGIGKSRLIEEFRDHLIMSDIVIIEGQCIERVNKTPWGLIKDILAEYLKTFQQYNNKEKKSISEQISNSCGDLGRIITDLYPPIKELIGNCPQVTELEPEKETQRIHWTITKFLYTISQTHNGFVLLLEDLQWCDSSSLKLLSEITKDISGYRLFIAGTYRNNEIDEYHNLNTIINNEKNSVETLAISNFDNLQMNKLISDILFENSETTEYLSQFIRTRTNGNPFYSIEILKHIISKGAITRIDESWILNKEILHNIEMPGTIIAALLKRIELFHEDDIDILCKAAVIGRRFNINLLTNLDNGNNNENLTKNIAVIDKAIDSQILEESYIDKEEIVFTHDRIREVFYQKLSLKRRKTYHLKIARTIESRHASDINEVLYDLAYHYIEGGDKEKILEYAYPSALKSIDDHSYEDAKAYLLKVMDILESDYKDDLQKENLKADCMTKLGETCLYTGKYDEALEIFNTILPRLDDIYKKLFVYQKIINTYFMKYDFKACEKYAAIGLKILNEHLPKTKPAIFLRTGKEIIFHILHNIFPFIFIRTKENKKNKKHKMIVEFYNQLYWAYYFDEVWKTPALILRMVNISESKIGTSKELATAYYYYGIICTGIPFLNRAKNYFQKSYDINKKIHNEHGIGQCLAGTGVYHLMNGEFKKCIEYCEKSITIFTKLGDFFEFAKTGLFMFLSYYFLSDYKNAEKINDQCYNAITNIFDEVMYTAFGVQTLYYIEIGQFDNAKDNLNKYSKVLQEMGAWHMYCISLMARGILHMEMDEIETSLEYYGKAFSIYKEHSFPEQYLNIIHPYYTIAMIKNYSQNISLANKKDRKAYLKKIKKSCKNSLKYAKPFKHHYDKAFRVFAGYYALINKNNKADKYFNLSIECSRKLEKLCPMGIAQYEYGLFLRATGKTDLAYDQFESAYLIFDKLGIEHRKNKVAKILNISKEENRSFNSVINTERNQMLLKSSEEINKYHNIEKLIDYVISKSMEITGASEGGLFLSDYETDELLIKGWKTSKGLNDSIKNDNFEYSRNIIEKVYDSGSAVITTDAENDDEYSAFKSVSRYELKSVICLPVKYNELINGVCYLHNPLVKGVFNNEDEQYLSAFLSHAALAIENMLLWEKLNNIKNNKEDDNPSYDENIEKIIAYLQENFTMEITREILGREFNMNPDYIGKMFKLYTGKSIRDYLNELRVNSTIDMLLKTDKQIIDIAFDAGFESVRTFNRIFFRIMGDTPSRYRART